MRKRKAMIGLAAADDHAIYLDNDEVICAFSLGDRTCFALGEPPFADMRAADYIAYERSLSGRSLSLGEIEYFAKALTRLDINRRLGGLGIVGYRAAQLLARYDLPVTELYVNFDGLPYSRRNASALKRFLDKPARRMRIFVAVSDFRFVPPDSDALLFTENGAVGAKCLTATTERGRLSLIKKADLDLPDRGRLRARRVTFTTGC